MGAVLPPPLPCCMAQPVLPPPAGRGPTLEAVGGRQCRRQEGSGGDGGSSQAMVVEQSPALLAARGPCGGGGSRESCRPAPPSHAGSQALGCGGSSCPCPQIGACASHGGRGALAGLRPLVLCSLRWPERQGPASSERLRTQLCLQGPPMRRPSPSIDSTEDARKARDSLARPRSPRSHTPRGGRGHFACASPRPQSPRAARAANRPNSNSHPERPMTEGRRRSRGRSACPAGLAANQDGCWV